MDLSDWIAVLGYPDEGDEGDDDPPVHSYEPSTWLTIQVIGLAFVIVLIGTAVGGPLVGGGLLVLALVLAVVKGR